jgi:hypothetical protein
MFEKLEEIQKLIFEHRKNLPENLKLLIITENEIIRVYKGMIEASSFDDKLAIPKNLKCERGDILDIFSKLEFIINELINLKVLGPNSEKSIMFDNILESINFPTKLRLLKDWGIIDNRLIRLIEKTRRVRNALAHKWSIFEVRFNNRPLRDTFEDFRNDMTSIWEQIIDIYQNEQEKIDIESIIKGD